MSLKVLLADDSMTAQNMGKKILADSGYEVTTVSNGAAAVKKIAEVKPDLIILDIYMPGYTGLEVCERVRANYETAKTPVLLTVGKMEPYRQEDGAKVRADGVIVKPFEATDLIAVVKKLSERLGAAPAPVQAENNGFEEYHEVAESVQDEEAPQAKVEVPAEMSAAPAMVFEEFSASEAPTMEFPSYQSHASWAPVAPEPHDLPVEAIEPPAFAEAVPALEPAFEPTIEPPVQVEAVSVPEFEPTIEAPAELPPVEALSDVEFTSAPQAIEVPAEHLNGVEEELGADGKPLEVAPVTDPALVLNPTEITQFATGFGVKDPEEIPVGVIPELAEPETSFQEEFAQAPEQAEAAAEPQTAEEPQAAPAEVDDFEARVAAAMAGFGGGESTQAAEVTYEPPAPELSPEPSWTQAQEENQAETPVTAVPEPELTVQHEAHEAAPIEVSHESEAPASQPAESVDEFEARVAAAMAAFESGPAGEEHATSLTQEEPVNQEVASWLEPEQKIEEPGMEPEAVAEAAPEEPVAAKPVIDFNETMVLPSEAVLSLEEEMQKVLAAELAATPAAAPAAEVTAEPEVAESITNSQPAFAEPPEAIEAAPAVQPEREFYAPGIAALGVAGGAFGLAAMHDLPVEPAAKEPEAPAHAASESPLGAAANGVPEINEAAAQLGSEKLASAVQRAIERMKPQLIEAILKELKGE